MIAGIELHPTPADPDAGQEDDGDGGGRLGGGGLDGHGHRASHLIGIGTLGLGSVDVVVRLGAEGMHASVAVYAGEVVSPDGGDGSGVAGGGGAGDNGGSVAAGPAAAVGLPVDAEDGSVGAALVVVGAGVAELLEVVGPGAVNLGAVAQLGAVQAGGGRGAVAVFAAGGRSLKSGKIRRFIRPLYECTCFPHSSWR